MRKDLAKSKTLSMFALPERYISHIADTYESRLEAYPCFISASCGYSVLANKGGASLFLYLATNLFLAKCQNAKQVIRGSIVPALHLSKILPKDSLLSCCKATSSDLLRRTGCIVVPHQLLLSGATTLSKGVTPRRSTCLTSWKPSGTSTGTDSLCRSWKQSAKAACRGIIVPALHRIGFFLSRTKKSPFVSNSSRWTSSNGSPRRYVSFSLA